MLFWGRFSWTLLLNYVCCVFAGWSLPAGGKVPLPTIAGLGGTEKKQKTTAPRIPAWSPTVVLTGRHSG